MERIDSLPPEIELAQLVQRCAARDAGALRLLYDKTSALLHARLLRMLGRRSVADLALQEVYVRVWERAAAYEAGRGRPLAWLSNIARYCAIDFMGREQLTLDADDVPVEPFPGNDAEPVALSNDEGIDALDAMTRLHLGLAYDGRSHEEIAQLTSAPLAAVKRSIRAGLLHLRDFRAREGQAA